MKPINNPDKKVAMAIRELIPNVDALSWGVG
jgi:hypothetical protein